MVLHLEENIGSGNDGLACEIGNSDAKRSRSRFIGLSFESLMAAQEVLLLQLAEDRQATIAKL